MNLSVETGLGSMGIRLTAAHEHQCAKCDFINAFFVHEVQSWHSF